MKKLFKPFIQADASITRQFGGTGLGLAITRSLIELMDGILDVKSMVGEGHSFTLTLRIPIENDSENNMAIDFPTEDDFNRLNLHGKAILIAEDNVLNQMILSELIAPTGATVIIANNGREAVEIVEREHVDLVFMDMQMPVMDGLQATRVIRTFKARENLPIVAVSANAMKEDKTEGFDVGMDDYITKPIELVQLYKSLGVFIKQKN